VRRAVEFRLEWARYIGRLADVCDFLCGNHAIALWPALSHREGLS